MNSFARRQRHPITTEERTALRRKAFWRVSDFARYTGMSARQARRVLIRYDVELHGMLLRHSRGKNRMYGFFWAALASHDSSAFIDDPLTMQQRVDKLEEDVSTLADRTVNFGIVTKKNEKEIRELKGQRSKAA